MEAGFCFKQALGVTFFNALDLLNSMEGENFKLQSFLNSATYSSDYYKVMFDGVEKEVEDECHLQKTTLKAIQDEIDKVKSNAKSIVDTHEKETERLKAKNEKL